MGQTRKIVAKIGSSGAQQPKQVGQSSCASSRGLQGSKLQPSGTLKSQAVVEINGPEKFPLGGRDRPGGELWSTFFMQGPSVQ
jgi:hypothetical protein